ncbi:MAG: outer membrane beta-barrel protein [Sphingomicrobium sp.]
MQKAIFAAALIAANAPAVAGNPYLGIDAGYTRARSNDVDETITYSVVPPGITSGKYDDVFAVRYRNGGDLSASAGYDFGWFRLEGELGAKRVGIKRIAADDLADLFVSDVNVALNRTGGPNPQALTLADFQSSGSLKVRSFMANAIFEISLLKDLNFYAGAGFGRSSVRGFNDHDTSSARQRMFGIRYRVSNQVELGLKHRNFRTGIIKLDHDPIEYLGSLAPGGTRPTATVIPDIEGEFRTRSLLLTVTYNVH